jgi:hypothetical protein
LPSDAIVATPRSLKVRATVGQANKIFAADFVDYKHASTGQVFSRTDSYAIGRQLRDHIEFIAAAIE